MSNIYDDAIAAASTVSCPTTPPTGTSAGTAGDLPVINLAGAFVIYAGYYLAPI